MNAADGESRGSTSFGVNRGTKPFHPSGCLAEGIPNPQVIAQRRSLIAATDYLERLAGHVAATLLHDQECARFRRTSRMRLLAVA